MLHALLLVETVLRNTLAGLAFAGKKPIFVRKVVKNRFLPFFQNHIEFYFNCSIILCIII